MVNCLRFAAIAPLSPSILLPGVHPRPSPPRRNSILVCPISCNQPIRTGKTQQPDAVPADENLLQHRHRRPLPKDNRHRLVDRILQTFADPSGETLVSESLIVRDRVQPIPSMSMNPLSRGRQKLLSLHIIDDWLSRGEGNRVHQITPPYQRGLDPGCEPSLTCTRG